jgi:hypothetical protein
VTSPRRRYPTDLTDAEWQLLAPACTTHTGVDPTEPSGRVKPMLISPSARCRRSPSGIASTFPTSGLPGGLGPTRLRTAVGG